MSSSVPKFGSFKPKFQVSNKKFAEDNDHDETRRDDSWKHDRDHHEKRDASRRKEEERPQKRGESSRHRGARKQVLNEDNSNSLYVLDREGDPEAPTYGKNKTSSIPSYRNTLTFRILGQSRGDDFHSNTGRSLLSSLTKDERKRLAADGRFFGPQSADDACYEEADDTTDADFLSLKHSGRKRHNLPRFDILGVPQTPSGIIEANVSDPPASDSGSSSSEMDAHEDFKTLQLKEENARLSNGVKIDSQNPELWLEFIDFQDKWLSHGQFTRKDDFSIEDTRSIAEVKLSMYEKALKAVSKDTDGRERLLLGLMEEAGKLYESSKLAKKWQELANSNKACLRLWGDYMKFSQKTPSQFQYNKCKQLYEEALGIIEDQSQRTLNHAQYFENLKAGVLLQLSCLMRDSGYSEHATALWQFLLEANFSRPADLDDTRDKEAILTRLEEFWDGECPRIGEQGAKGWSNMVGHETAQVMSLTSLVKEHYPHRFRNWAIEEVSRSSRQLWPSRTVEDEDDPFRVVLFSDLCPYLTLLKTDKAKIRVINAYLSFWNLPGIRDDTGSASANSHWASPITLSDFRGYERYDIGALGREQDVFRTELSKFSPNLFKQYQGTTEMLFSSVESPFVFITNQACVDHIVNVLDLLCLSTPPNEDLAEYLLALLSHADKSKARKKAKTLLKANSSSLRLYNAYALVEKTLGNEENASRVFLTAIKMSSSLSVEAQENAVLLRRNWVWSVLEINLDRETALQRLVNSCKDVPQDFDGNQTMALNEQEIRDADSYLRQNLDKTLASFTKKTQSALWRLIPYHAELLVLLTYLTTEDLTETLTSYEHLISYISTVIHTSAPQHTTSIVEHLHQLRAALIAHHTRSHPRFSPIDVRSALNDSTTLFPHNTIFLTLRLENEARFKFDDRVRSVVHEAITAPHNPTTDDSIQAQAYRIALELRRYHRNDSGLATPTIPTGVATQEDDDDDEQRTPDSRLPPLTTPHAVRAVFERALSTAAAANNAVLWRTYLVFELSQHARTLRGAARNRLPPASRPKTEDASSSDAFQGGHGEVAKQRERVRNVYFRGLGALPWHKGFAMMGFLYLGDSSPAGGEAVMSDVEMKAVYDGLGEKGLRISGELG